MRDGPFRLSAAGGARVVRVRGVDADRGPDLHDSLGAGQPPLQEVVEQHPVGLIDRLGAEPGVLLVINGIAAELYFGSPRDDFGNGGGLSPRGENQV